jgi:hypothetical protein
MNIYLQLPDEAAAHARRAEDSRTSVMSTHALETHNTGDIDLLEKAAPVRKHDGKVFLAGDFYTREQSVFSPNRAISTDYANLQFFLPDLAFTTVTHQFEKFSAAGHASFRGAWADTCDAFQQKFMERFQSLRPSAACLFFNFEEHSGGLFKLLRAMLHLASIEDVRTKAIAISRLIHLIDNANGPLDYQNIAVQLQSESAKIRVINMPAHVLLAHVTCEKYGQQVPALASVPRDKMNLGSVVSIILEAAARSRMPKKL